MAITLLEIRMLQDVLVTLTSISTGTIQTLINLSKEKSHNDKTTQTLENEIIRLKGSIEAANGLVTFYDQRLREERENGAIKRHMEEAKILTDSIRAIRRVEINVDMPLPSRRNTSHISGQPVSFESKRSDQLTKLTTTKADSKTTVNLQRVTIYQGTVNGIDQRPVVTGNPPASYNAELRAGFRPFRQPRNRPRAVPQEPTPVKPPSKAATIRHTKAIEQNTQSTMELGLTGSASMPFRRGLQLPPPKQSLMESCSEVPHTTSRSISDGIVRL
jgi:hypothetical protein